MRAPLPTQVDVRSADAEGTDAGPARRWARLPLGQLRVDDEGAVGEIDLRVGRGKVEACRQLPVLERQARLDQPDDTGGGITMPEISLDRTDRAEALSLRTGAEGLSQRRNLDRIAQRGGRAMRFDVGDRVGTDAGIGVRAANRLGLSLDARSGIADLVRAIVVKADAFDHRINLVAVLHRILQALEHDDAETVAEEGAARVGIERPALSIARETLPSW